MTLAQLGMEFTRSEIHVDELLRAHDPERLNLQPAPGRWSALQCIEHLSLANEWNARALGTALRTQPRVPAVDMEIRAGLLWRFILKGVEPGTRMKGFAPRSIRPAAHLDPVSTHSRFLATHEVLRGLLDECRGIDFNRIQFPHPAIKLRISAGAMFWLLALHESRHLQQAQRAVDHP